MVAPNPAQARGLCLCCAYRFKHEVRPGQCCTPCASLWNLLDLCCSVEHAISPGRCCTRCRSHVHHDRVSKPCRLALQRQRNGRCTANVQMGIGSHQCAPRGYTKPAISAANRKYATSLQRSASAPETMVTDDDAKAMASRKRAIWRGSESALRSRKNCSRAKPCFSLLLASAESHLCYSTGGASGMFNADACEIHAPTLCTFAMQCGSCGTVTKPTLRVTIAQQHWLRIQHRNVPRCQRRRCQSRRQERSQSGSTWQC